MSTRDLSKRLHFDASHAKGKAARERRVPELDSLRGLAALAIVIYHADPRIIPFGWAAVDLFFVLSGYLITSIILRHGSTPGFLVNFYVRRGLRVWPIYFLLIGLLVALNPLLYTPCDWRALGFVLTFTQGIQHYWSNHVTHFSDYFSHTWTLAIEEQFYLIWPALILLVGRGRVVALSLICLAGTLLIRSRGLDVFLLGTRADGLALGGLLAAILARFTPEGRNRPGLVALFGLVAVLASIPLAMSGAFTNSNVWAVIAARPVVSILAFNLLWFGVVGLVVCQTGRPMLGVLRLRPLTGLGVISYGVYLYHYPLITFINQQAIIVQKLPGRPLWLDAAFLVACLGSAWLSWIFIERPILNLKDRFNYGGRTATPTTSGPHARPIGTAAEAEIID